MMTNQSNRVHVSQVRSDQEVSQAMADAFSWLGDGIVKPGDRVFVKPNLTYPFHKPGVTTSPTVMEALVRLLVDITKDVTFVESDGGAYAWPADEAMAGHGLPELCRRYGVKMMNLTERPRKTVDCQIDGHEVSVELPAEMLDESDLLITMPVPKVHVMTYLTLGFKNQWGCLPDVKRLRNHPQFVHKVLAINQALRTRVAVFDGRYFLNRSGPMDGDPVKKDLLVVSDGVGAGNLVCCELMGLSPHRAPHLKLAQQIDMMPSSLDELTLNTDLSVYKGESFFLRRSPINWVTLVSFHSELLTRLVYDSRFAKPIHELLYLVRGRPKDVSPKW